MGNGEVSVVTDDEVVIVDAPTPATLPSSSATTRARPSTRSRTSSSSQATSHTLNHRETTDEPAPSPPQSPLERRGDEEGATTDGTADGASAASSPAFASGENARDEVPGPIGEFPNQDVMIGAVAAMDIDDNSKPMNVDADDNDHGTPRTIEIPSSPETSASKPTSTKSDSPLPSLPPLSSQPNSDAAKAPSDAGKSDTKANGVEHSHASQSAKPKSQKRRSPSPPAQPSRVEVNTIRLSISLGGPENYAVDIRELARESGQLLEPPKAESSDSEGEDEPEAAPEAGPSVPNGVDGQAVVPAKRGRGKGREHYYDTSDPFIDDSELAVDERKYFAQTKQQGFYVSSGEVAVVKDRSGSKKGAGLVDEKHGILQLESPMKKPRSSRKIIPTIIPLAGSLSGSMSTSSSGPVAGPSLVMLPPSQGAPISPGPRSAEEQKFSSTLLIPPTPTARASGSDSGFGSRDTPITIDDAGPSSLVLNSSAVNGVEAISTTSAPPSTSANGTGTAAAGDLKRKASEQSASGRKKRKTVDIDSFSPTLQQQLQALKVAIAKENWEQKGKFPPNLKPALSDTAVVAIRCGEYDDRFFSLMPKLFIYNKFTMTKLIKRTVYPVHQDMLSLRMEELLGELKMEVDTGFEKSQADYEAALAHWKARKEGDGNVSGTPNESASGTPYMNGGGLPSSSSQLPIPHINISAMEVDTPPPPGSTQLDGGADKPAGEGRDRDGPPARRVRLNSRMRDIIWELVVLSNESVRIENEKNTYESSPVVVSEQGARKILYSKIVNSFPDGWMNSGQISREVSIMKKKFETQQQEAAETASAG